MTPTKTTTMVKAKTMRVTRSVSNSAIHLLHPKRAGDFYFNARYFFFFFKKNSPSKSIRLFSIYLEIPEDHEEKLAMLGLLALVAFLLHSDTVALTAANKCIPQTGLLLPQGTTLCDLPAIFSALAMRWSPPVGNPPSASCAGQPYHYNYLTSPSRLKRCCGQLCHCLPELPLLTFQRKLVSLTSTDLEWELLAANSQLLSSISS